MKFQARLEKLLAGENIHRNLARPALIKACVDNGEALISACGALATWTRPESTGRSPADTIIVKRPESAHTIDWTAANNLPVDPETFDMLVEDALKTLKKSKKVYASDRVIGADASYALPVTTVANKALNVLFCDNMFRPVPKGIKKSIFGDQPFTLLACPDQKLDPERYKGRLRIDPKLGHTSTMVIAVDFDRRIGVVYGSAYCGSCKKLLFTVMNYLLPAAGILPIHCSANEGKKGDIALLLGLSGTGKTTLSADKSRALLGDDEHGWNENGVANFEHGCYAKLIDLNPKKEPEIFKACFHKAPYTKHGAIIENAMMYPNGEFDLFDDRFTPNSRGSYLLSALSNIKKSSTGGHPQTILFLTADANGVLPPVSKLTREQAMLWFLMGYTSKLAGTETGVTEPKSAFSRFFGAPFMPRNPDDYASLLGQKLERARHRGLPHQHRLERRPLRRGQPHGHHADPRHVRRGHRGQAQERQVREGSVLQGAGAEELPGRGQSEDPGPEEHLERQGGLRRAGPEAGRRVRRPVEQGLCGQGHRQGHRGGVPGTLEPGTMRSRGASARRPFALRPRRGGPRR